jgi:hypothetical protein
MSERTDRLTRRNEESTEKANESRKMNVYVVADAVRVQFELRSRSYCTCAEGLSSRVVLQYFANELYGTSGAEKKMLNLEVLRAACYCNGR